MPEDAQDYLSDWAKILRITLPEKYLYGEGPRSPKQQGWWNEKEPYQGQGESRPHVPSEAPWAKM
jgi:hypothetical protein